MKKIASKILLFLIFVVSNHLSKAQTSKVWVTIADEAHVPFRDDRGMLRSNDSVFNYYLNALQIISIDKPFSASRTRELQRVYEL
jgi:hypothetical protein